MASNLQSQSERKLFSRGPSPGVGKDYERFVTALIMIRLFSSSSPDLPQREFDDFHFGFNLKNMGNIDDLVIFLKKNQKPLINIAVQLKHSNRTKLSGTMLCSDKGDFAIKTYLSPSRKSVIDQFILFTNLSFNEHEIMKKSEKNVNAEKNFREYSIRKLNGLEFLQTNCKENFIYSFTPNSESLQENSDEFFRKFLLYANQKSCFEMEEEIKKTLSEQFNADEHSQMVYIELCSWWHNNKEVKDVIPREPKLDRRGIGKILVISLLKPFLVTVQPPLEHQKKWNLFIEAAKKFTVTVLGSCDVCKNWTSQLENNNYSIWTNSINAPVFVYISEPRYFNQVLKAVHILNEIDLRKNLIVFGSLESVKFKEEVSLFKDLSQVDERILQDVLREFHLPLEVLLNFFEKNRKEVLSEVTPSLLFDFITNRDKRSEEELPKCYVHRTIEAPLNLQDDASKSLEKKEIINENALISTKYCDKINILCAETGMGKSTTLKLLHNQLLSQNFYPKLISLKNHVRFFKNCITNNVSVESILKHFLNIDNMTLSNLVTVSYLSQDRVCLLFDGLDELDSKYLNTAIECIMKLTINIYTVKIWVSTRKHLQSQVEDAFKVDVFDLSLITENDQKKYIQARLNSTFDKDTISNIIKNVYDNFTLLFEQNCDILGIPLQLFIITEVLLDNVDDYEETNIRKLMVLSKLYHEFFKGKVWHALKKTGQFKHLDNFYNITDYEIVALKACLDESEFKFLNIQNYNKSVENIKNSSPVGIVTNFNDDGVAVFAHQTFAEYFCASYFVNTKERLNTVYLKQFFFQHKYNIIRLFINMKLSEESPLHLAVIFSNFDTIINADENEIKACKDKGGRNLLQAAISCGVNYPHLESIKNRWDDIYTHQIALNVKLENIFKYLYSIICDFVEDDELFKFSSYEYAINMNDLSIINIMLGYKPHNLFLQNYCLTNGESILSYSAKYGFINLFKILTLKLRFDFVDTVKFKRTNRFDSPWCKAIHFAVENGRVDYLKFLLLRNVNIHSEDSNGKTALHWAAQRAEFECIKELIAYGAKINAKDSIARTPLHLAAQNGDSRCLRELIAKGACVNSEESNGCTPLHLAAEKNNLHCLQQLIAAGAIVNSKNSFGGTPLDWAALNGALECLEELIANGADVNSKDVKGWTSLHWVAEKGKLECLRQLLANGADVNAHDSNGWTALHWAAKEGKLHCLQELIAKNAEIDLKERNGFTALHVAAEGGELECLQELIANGADVNAHNLAGETPLYWAEKREHFECLQELVDKGATINSFGG